MFDLINRFKCIIVAIHTDTPGRVDKSSVLQALQNSGESYDQARETLKHVSVDASGKVELEDWVEVPQRQATNTDKGLCAGYEAGKVTVKGSNANVSHTINEDERTEFTNHINGVIENDSDIGSRFPIPTATMQIFDECRDGLVLCKLINDSVPDTIDTRVLNIPTARKPLNAFQMTENNNIVITSAKAIGCSVVNIGPSDIAEGREHLILGLIWQIIRRGLLAQVDIKLHPELYRLCEDGETIDDLLRLTPDQILLRWFNYHLKAAGWKRRVNNFSRDVCDGENYTVLLNQLKPEQCSLAPLQTRDIRQRAEQYLTVSLVAGNPRLNLAFVQSLQYMARLAPLDEQEAKDMACFTLWLNSLGVEPGVYNLFENIKMVWRRSAPPTTMLEDEEQEDIGVKPNQSTLSRFKQVENTNYAVELGKQMECTSWAFKVRTSSTGRKLLSWGKPGTRPIRSFKDPSITTGLFFLNVLEGLRPGIVDPALIINVSETGPYEDRRQNAKLAISIARKMNA
ncbi:calponin homology domain-containing protein [Pisolithus marmoratus]|nr:calponin homology domain-containing protein [Pisolithus marmoratus]